MLCPQCEQEYAWHVMVRPACDVDTSTSCRGKIDYFVRGKGLQDLFGLGRTTNYSFAMGPAEFWVRAEDADNVRVLLLDLIVSSENRS